MTDEQAGPATIAEVVSANLRTLRKEKGWNQRTAAGRISERMTGSWSEKTYANAEGARPMRFTAEQIAAIAVAFGVPLQRLFDLPAETSSETVSGLLGQLARLHEPQSLAYPTATAEEIGEGLEALAADLAESRAEHDRLAKDAASLARDAQQIGDRFRHEF